ncbi:MAG: acyl carrier protein [Bacteroidota bacterium]|nr:acyl carrier protein [Bacteroidota bacterium]
MSRRPKFINKMLQREKIKEIVLNTIKEFQVELDDDNFNLNEGETTRLFGGGASLDSLSLVRLIIQIEEAIEEHLNISIVLASEQAMSRRTSPFSRISYLIDYIYELVNTQQNGK